VSYIKKRAIYLSRMSKIWLATTTAAKKEKWVNADIGHHMCLPYS
jgi:hypothetical protein